jgi:hypothetical protein
MQFRATRANPSRAAVARLPQRIFASCMHAANAGNTTESGRVRESVREGEGERARESARERERERAVEVDRPASHKAQRQTISKTLLQVGHRTYPDSLWRRHSSWPRVWADFFPLPPCRTRPRTRRASRQMLPRSRAPASPSLRRPAHTAARRAGASNNWDGSGLQCSLRAWASQIKLSHVDAVARNARQCHDRLHARRREPPLQLPDVFHVVRSPVLVM